MLKNNSKISELYEKYSKDENCPLYLFNGLIDLKDNSQISENNSENFINFPTEREYGLEPYYYNNLYTKTGLPASPVPTKYMPICYREDLDKTIIYKNIMENNLNPNEFDDIYDEMKRFTNFYDMLDYYIENFKILKINWLYMDIDPNFNNSYFIKKLLLKNYDLLYIFKTYFNLDITVINDFNIAIICQMLNNFSIHFHEYDISENFDNLNLNEYFNEKSKSQLINIKNNIIENNIKFYDIVKYILDEEIQIKRVLILMPGKNLCYLNTCIQILYSLNIKQIEEYSLEYLIKEYSNDLIINEIKLLFMGTKNNSEDLRKELNKIYKTKYLYLEQNDATEALIDILDYLFIKIKDLDRRFKSKIVEKFWHFFPSEEERRDEEENKLIRTNEIYVKPTIITTSIESSEINLNEKNNYTDENGIESIKTIEYEELPEIIFINKFPNEKIIHSEIKINNIDYIITCGIIRYNFNHCVAVVGDKIYDDSYIREYIESDLYNIQTLICEKLN